IITKNGTEIPIDYRMLKRGNRWYVYDVNIEGVSLVNNYRPQFDTIMRSSSFDGLVKKLKDRIEELRRQTGPPACFGAKRATGRASRRGCRGSPPTAGRPPGA